MDWFTLLLVFIFFVLPLIQQIAEARKRSQEPEPLEPEEWEMEEEPAAERSGPPRRNVPESTTSPDSGSWSEGWGAWPGEEPVTQPVPPAETPPVPAPVPAPARAEVEIRTPPVREERAVPVPRAERSVPVPRAERVVYERPVPVDPVYVDRGEASPRARPAPRPREMSVPVYGARRETTALGAAVHNRAELRRAVLLAEVLGPPRSLQPLETERG
jgi:hypothetical protein